METGRRCNPESKSVSDDAVTADRLERSLIAVSEILAWLQNDCFIGKRAADQYVGLGVAAIERAFHTGEIPTFRIRRKNLIAQERLRQLGAEPPDHSRPTRETRRGAQHDAAGMHCQSEE